MGKKLCAPLSYVRLQVKKTEGRGSGKKKKCELGKLKLTKTDHFVEVAVCVSVCVKTSRKPRESMLRS